MRHLTNSLVDGTLTEAVEALAKIAADRRARPQTFQEKRAEGASDYLTALGDRLNSAGTSVMGAGMPISHGLLGGGIGAGLGGLSALLGNSGKEEKDKRSVLGSVLTGGLAGGGLGAGIGMGRQYLKDTAAPPSADSTILQTVHQRMKDLTATQPATAGIRGVAGQAYNHLLRNIPPFPGLQASLGIGDGSDILSSAAPITSSIMPRVMAVDALAHSGLLGRHGFGLTGARHSTLPEDLVRGAMESVGHNNREVAAVSSALAGQQTQSNTAMAFGARPGESLAETFARRNTAGPLAETLGRVPGVPGSVSPTRGIIQELMRVGRDNRLPEGIPRNIYRVGGSTFRVPGWKAQLLGRAIGYPLAYAGGLGAEALWADHQRQGQLQQLLQSPETQALLRAPAQRSQ